MNKINKAKIIRFIYYFVGAAIGGMALVKFSTNVKSNTPIWCIIFLVIGMIFGKVIEDSAKTQNQKIFYLIICIVFSYPIACIMQYVVALIVVLWGLIGKIIHVVVSY